VKGIHPHHVRRGLETMLRKGNGVAPPSAIYPEAKIIIGLDAGLTTEKALKGLSRASAF
jgi:hypothetical protein